jgi:hypothetical protein
VASDSNGVVPIVSFKELPRSDWKRLPDLIASGFNGRASMVVCTHLDQVSQDNMDEQLKTVTKIFWPEGGLNTNRVISCSSLMGLSARDLLDISSNAKPPFRDIWNRAVGYYVRRSLFSMACTEQPSSALPTFWGGETRRPPILGSKPKHGTKNSKRNFEPVVSLLLSKH